MKAARFAANGDPDVLRLVEVEEPHAGPGKVRIAVCAAGINGIDRKLRSGMMHEQWHLELPSGRRRGSP